MKHRYMKPENFSSDVSSSLLDAEADPGEAWQLWEAQITQQRLAKLQSK